MNAMVRVCLPLVLVVLLLGCANLPTSVRLPAGGVRVLSYSLERAVRIGNLNGVAEEKPGILSSNYEGYDAPLHAALEQGWSALSDQAVAEGLGHWQGPGLEADHPAWVAASVAPISTLSFDLRRARGYYWPKEFRFLDPGTSLGAVALEFPDELLLTIEYRAFIEDVGEPGLSGTDVQLGLWATFRLYGTSGQLIAQEQVTGRSHAIPRVGGMVNRGAYPGLFVQAQAEALKEWARRIQFRTVY